MPPAANGRVDPPPNFPSLNQIPGATPLTSDAHAGRWNGPNKLKRPPRRPTRFSFSALRRSFSPSLSPSSTGSEHAQKPPPPIGHQARICYVVMTGAVPPQDKSEGMCKEKREAVGEKTSRGQSLSEVNSLGQEEGSREIAATHKGGAKAITPVVKTKAVRKLKSDLLRPDKARSIIADLKRMDVPDGSGDGESSDTTSTIAKPRAFALQSSSPANFQPQPVASNFSALALPTSEGALAGLASAKSGAFEVLADVSGALVRRTGARDGFVAPFDSIGLFILLPDWWGYEISLPPPMLVKLSSVRSVQQTFFGFLQAFVIGGGAPEIAPFIRYISSYLDMEFAAIQSQNKGNGVVLAATWILPIALVPRPWDFPPPSITKDQRDGSRDKREQVLSGNVPFVPILPLIA